MAGRTPTQTDDHDIVWTLAEIGKIMNRDRRAVEHMLVKHPSIPIFKTANNHWASRKELLAWMRGGKVAA